MRTLHLVTLTAISLLSLSSQCGKEEPTPAPPPPAQPQSPPPPVTPPSVPACARTIAFTQVPGVYCLPEPIADIGQSKQYVVRSGEEYRAVVQCTTAPAIDFTQSTLLIGKTKTASQLYFLSQKVEQACTGRYTYTVQISPGAGGPQAVTEMYYHALVPKLPADAQIDFDVQVVR